MKYFIWILGCAMNYSDAERISAVLDSLGYSRTFNEKESDLFIVISCSVRQSAINRIFGKIRDLNETKADNPNFKTVLSGCVLQEDRKKMAKAFDILFEIKDLEMLPEMLADILPSTVIPTMAEGSYDNPPDSKVVQAGLLDDKQKKNDKLLSGEYLSITPHYESTFRAYVPISTGCNNFCTYCAVPYTRGREKSRPMAEIVNEVRKLIESGYKEITLIGQNVNSYGNDLPPVIPGEAEESLLSNGNQMATSKFEQISPCNDKAVLNNYFVHLLLEIDKIEGDYRIYFYSNHPKDMSDELIETLPKLKHFPHYIHLPLQSGNNEIIQKMNRHYTKERYLELVKKIRAALPDVNLTTDIIAGFPGETEKQFQDTVEVLKEAEYDMAFIAQYSRRPGTVAAKSNDDVSKEEKRQREDILQNMLAEIVLGHNQKLVGTIQKVLIDEKKADKYYGRTEGYKVVEIKTDQSLELGQFIDIKIESATAWKLLGI